MLRYRANSFDIRCISALPSFILWEEKSTLPRWIRYGLCFPEFQGFAPVHVALANGLVDVAELLSEANRARIAAAAEADDGASTVEEEEVAIIAFQHMLMAFITGHDLYNLDIVRASMNGYAIINSCTQLHDQAWTPLSLAVQMDASTDLLQMLFELGAEPNHVFGPRSMCPLHIASSERVARWLMDRGARLDAEEIEVWTGFRVINTSIRVMRSCTTYRIVYFL